MDKDVAVVIGVGGMGVAISRRLGSGRSLLLADLNETTLAAAADQLRGEGHDALTKVVDVAKPESVTSLANKAAGLGRVTHIAHTAGLSPVQASTAAILRVDLLGVAIVLEELGRVVAPGGAGVVIASMAGHMASGIDPALERALAVTAAAQLLELPALADEAVGDPGAAYMLAKRANILRVQAAAATWGARGARINSISPGVISTPMGQQELAGPYGDQMRATVDFSAAKRLGTPDDIAAAAEFLLGPSASFITGADLLIDGGVVAAVQALLSGA